MTKLEKYGNKVAEAAALEGRPEGVGSGSDSQLLPFIFKKEDTMKSARINFGIPDSEYIMEVDDSGAATSLVNQDTNTEYVGGGGGGNFSTAQVTFVGATSEKNIIVYGAIAAEMGDSGASYAEELVRDNTNLSLILYKGFAMVTILPSRGEDNITVSGDITPLTPGGNYRVTGDCIVTIS